MRLSLFFLFVSSHVSSRTEFALDENGDVTWEVQDEAEPLPLFNCETYEVRATSIFCVFLISFEHSFVSNGVRLRNVMLRLVDLCMQFRVLSVFLVDISLIYSISQILEKIF